MAFIVPDDHPGEIHAYYTDVMPPDSTDWSLDNTVQMGDDVKAMATCPDCWGTDVVGVVALTAADELVEALYDVGALGWFSPNDLADNTFWMGVPHALSSGFSASRNSDMIVVCDDTDIHIFEMGLFLSSIPLDPAVVGCHSTAVGEWDGVPTVVVSAGDEVFVGQGDSLNSTTPLFNVSVSGAVSLVTTLVAGKPAMAYINTGVPKLVYRRSADASGSVWGPPQQTWAGYDMVYDLDFLAGYGVAIVARHAATGTFHSFRSEDLVGTVWHGVEEVGTEKHMSASVLALTDTNLLVLSEASQTTVLTDGVSSTQPPSPTPSPTPSGSPTPSPSSSGSLTPSPPASGSLTPSPSASGSSTPVTKTPSTSLSGSDTATPTISDSVTSTSSLSESSTSSVSVSLTPTPTLSTAASQSASKSPSVSDTTTATATASGIPSPFPSTSVSDTASLTSSVSVTPTLSTASSQSASKSASVSDTATSTVTATATATASGIPLPSPPTGTTAPSPSPSPSPTPSPSPSMPVTVLTPTVLASLSSPSTIGEAQTAVFDATSSTLVYDPLIPNGVLDTDIHTQYLWSANVSSSHDLVPVLSAANGSSPVLSVHSSVLKIGDIVGVECRVQAVQTSTGAVVDEARATAVLTRVSGANNVGVAIVGPAQRVLPFGLGIGLKAHGTSPDIRYTWRMVHANDVTGLGRVPPPATRVEWKHSGDRLSVNPAWTSPGMAYTFEVEACDGPKSSPSCVTASAVVEVDMPSVGILVSGFPSAGGVWLRAASAVSDASSSLGTMSVDWACESTNCPSPASPSSSSTPFHNTTALKTWFGGSDVTPGDTYEVMATLHRTFPAFSQSYATTVSVTVPLDDTTDGIPVSVDPVEASYIPATARARLKGASDSGVDSLWSVHPAFAPSTDVSHYVLGSGGEGTIQTLTVSPGALPPRRGFAFRFDTPSVGSFTSMTLKWASSPVGGAVSVSPSTGSAQITTFTSVTTEWWDVTDSLPLMFEVSAVSGSSRILLSALQPAAVAVFTMPLSTVGPAGVVMEVKAMNVFGATTIVTTESAVVVSPPSLSDMLTSNDTIVESAVGLLNSTSVEEDPQGAVQSASTVVAMLSALQCDGVVCSNGAMCSMGVCDCSGTGYTGLLCDDAVVNTTTSSSTSTTTPTTDSSTGSNTTTDGIPCPTTDTATECSGHGTCRRHPRRACALGLSSCAVACKCEDGWTGKGCGSTEAQAAQRQQVRKAVLETLGNVATTSYESDPDTMSSCISTVVTLVHSGHDDVSAEEAGLVVDILSKASQIPDLGTDTARDILSGVGVLSAAVATSTTIAVTDEEEGHVVDGGATTASTNSTSTYAVSAEAAQTMLDTVSNVASALAASTAALGETVTLSADGVGMSVTDVLASDVGSWDGVLPGSGDNQIRVAVPSDALAASTSASGVVTMVAVEWQHSPYTALENSNNNDGDAAHSSTTDASTSGVSVERRLGQTSVVHATTEFSVRDESGSAIEVADLTTPLTLMFEATPGMTAGGDTPLCHTFDEDKKAWVSSGVSPVGTRVVDGKTFFVCATVHLSAFELSGASEAPDVSLNTVNPITDAKELKHLADPWNRTAPTFLLMSLMVFAAGLIASTCFAQTKAQQRKNRRNAYVKYGSLKPQLSFRNPDVLGDADLFDPQTVLGGVGSGSSESCVAPRDEWEDDTVPLRPPAVVVNKAAPGNRKNLMTLMRAQTLSEVWEMMCRDHAVLSIFRAPPVERLRYSMMQRLMVIGVVFVSSLMAIAMVMGKRPENIHGRVLLGMISGSLVFPCRVFLPRIVKAANDFPSQAKANSVADERRTARRHAAAVKAKLRQSALGKGLPKHRHKRGRTTTVVPEPKAKADEGRRPAEPVRSMSRFDRVEGMGSRTWTSPLSPKQKGGRSVGADGADQVVSTPIQSLTSFRLDSYRALRFGEEQELDVQQSRPQSDSDVPSAVLRGTMRRAARLKLTLGQIDRARWYESKDRQKASKLPVTPISMTPAEQFAVQLLWMTDGTAPATLQPSKLTVSALVTTMFTQALNFMVVLMALLLLTAAVLTGEDVTLSGWAPLVSLAFIAAACGVVAASIADKGFFRSAMLLDVVSQGLGIASLIQMSTSTYERAAVLVGLAGVIHVLVWGMAVYATRVWLAAIIHVAEEMSVRQAKIDGLVKTVVGLSQYRFLNLEIQVLKLQLAGLRFLDSVRAERARDVAAWAAVSRRRSCMLWAVYGVMGLYATLALFLSLVFSVKYPPGLTSAWIAASLISTCFDLLVYDSVGVLLRASWRSLRGLKAGINGTTLATVKEWS